MFFTSLLWLQRGANVIFPVMMSGDQSTLHPPKSSKTAEPKKGLVSTYDGIMFDASAHFGCNRTTHKDASKSKLTYSVCRHKLAAIQAAAACPGLQPADSSTVSPTCDAHATSVALAKGKFIPLHLDGGLFSRDAFWALPAPLVADSDESLMWSLIIQRLLWLSGNQIVVQRCRTNLSAKISSRMLSAMHLLDKWQCSSKNMTTCIKDLTNNSGLLNSQMSFTNRYWMDVLAQSGYAFPQFSDLFNEDCHKVVFHAVDHSVSIPRQDAERYSPINNIDSMKKLYHNTCHRPNITLPKYSDVNFAKPWTQFRDMLLVVIFNTNHYEAIPYIEILNRPFFPNILYCGPFDIEYEKFPGLNNFTFSFVTYDRPKFGKVTATLNYKCMTTAMQMNYNVRGYLAVSDDLLMLVHTLAELTQNAVWYMPKTFFNVGDLITRTKYCNTTRCGFRPKWPWWKDFLGATTDVLAEIEKGKNSSPLLRTCHQRMVSLNGAANHSSVGFSDVYYIPSNLTSDFIELSELFLRNHVFIEIAVPTTIRCLALPEDIVTLEGENMLDRVKRKMPWLYYLSGNLGGMHYVHPLKWGFLAGGSMDYSQLYCTKVIPHLHDPLARLNA